MIVGIVQGNIDQSVKWSPAQQQRTVEKYLRNQISFCLQDDRHWLSGRRRLCLFIRRPTVICSRLRSWWLNNNFALLTGAPWYEIIDRRSKKVNFYNSALLLQPDGQFGGKYYKSHLVPFGEYVPLKKFLPFLAPLVEAVGDFSLGRLNSLWSGRRQRSEYSSALSLFFRNYPVNGYWPERICWLI